MSRRSRPSARPAVGGRGAPAVAILLVLTLAASCASPVPSPSPTPATSSGSALSPSATSASPNPIEPSIGPASSHTASPFAGPTSSPTTASASPEPLPTCPAETQRFPSGYGAYHTEAATCRALVAAAMAHPDIVRLFAIGRSFEGRPIWAMEIGAHLADGTHPPAVLFDGLHHALEHLSLEMTLGIMGWLVDGYGADPTVTALVRSRDVLIVFAVNPDGAAFDIGGGVFHEWRKNRQPGPGGAVGTDLNRNYDDHWGCCGLVSADPSSPYFRGAAPFSAPETAAVRDLVLSRVFQGRQQIRVAITFHASGRLVLWPYGYTTQTAPSPMTATDHAVFVTMGTTMASMNGYRPEQASGLYIDSGTARDWYYGSQRIFAFTFELGSGTYQTSPAVAPEVARNRRAILYLIGLADCPYRAIGHPEMCSG